MRVDTQPSEVRSIVVGMFERFGSSAQTLFELEETVRLDQGKPTARTYRVDGLMAMWMLDIGIVQFYDEDGNMLATVNVFKKSVAQPMVA